MKKLWFGAPAVLLGLTGCGAAGDTAGCMNVTMIYGATAVLSLLLLIGYCCIDRKRDPWFLLLFSSVLVVNIGYVALSISGSLEEALLANRIAYLGSVFLPMSMLMIILHVSNIRCWRWLPFLLTVLALFTFLIAASPGYLDIYYKEVYFATVDGVSVLQKVYGPWHCLYAVYLLLYFAAMVGAIGYAAAKKKMESTGHAVILAIAVFVNLGVWLIGQLIHFSFEFLSVSYIISELFLLGLHLVIAENQRLKSLVAERDDLPAPVEEEPIIIPEQPETPEADDSVERFIAGRKELTKTEKMIYDAYIARVTTKEILEALNIKENTLKFHNKNIYHKLGVSSRKELQEIHRRITPELCEESVDGAVAQDGENGHE